MILPQFLLNFLAENNYTCEKILQYNERKHTYVLKIKKHNNFYLLKAYDKYKTPRDIQNKFIIEKKFYKKNKYIIKDIPKVINIYDNILILEYIEGISLRDYLIQKEFNEFILINLLNSVENFNIKIYRNKVKSNNLNFNNIFRYINMFSNSHPFQARNIELSFLEKSLNKIIAKLLIKKSKKILKSFCKRDLKNDFSHNDFHYNNILVTTDNRIKFIDFENVKYEGFFEFDILALIVMIEVYINDDEKKNLYEYLENLFKKNNNLKDIYYIYKIAISINKKFYVDSNRNYLTKFEKIKLIINLIKGDIYNV